MKIIQGDCLDVLKTLEDNSVDAVITDPPAGIGFMGKEWDSNKGGRDEWISWLALRMKECLRVLKPGGHMLVWALPRTSHWTATALEDAGFEIRDRVSHLFGTGFPKSLNVSKAIDAAGGASPKEQARILMARRKALGLARQEVANLVGCTAASVRDWEIGRARASGRTIEYIVPSKAYRAALARHLEYSTDERVLVGVSKDRRDDQSTYALGHSGIHTAGGNTRASRQYEGFGTALKPACEDWWLVRKPVEHTIVANVLEYGTGALNIDASRIGNETLSYTSRGNTSMLQAGKAHGYRASEYEHAQGNPSKTVEGRWPSHVVLSHSPDCTPSGTKVEKGHKGYPNGPGGKSVHWGEGTKRSEDCRTEAWEGIPDKEVTAWECAEGCAVAELDAQSGVTTSGAMKRRVGAYEGESVTGFLRGDSGPHNQHGGTGGASRFFYCAKPSKREKSSGLEEANKHPTVKSTRLMGYLIKMITPPGGVVLDPFCGSGSTGVACAQEGFDFIGIEAEEEYAKVAEARVAHALIVKKLG